MIKLKSKLKSRFQNNQVFQTGIMVSILILVAATLLVGGATAQQGAEITLSDPSSSTHGTNYGSSQVPKVTPSTPITYNNGANYEFVITDTDTGGTITTIPSIQATTSDRVVMNNPTGAGIQTTFNFWVIGTTGGPVDAQTETTGSVTAPGVANLTVSLVDASTGQVVDETQARSFVIGYVADYSQNSTTGTVEVSVNQSVLPDGTSISATIYNSSVTFPSDTNDSTSTSLTLNSAENEFVGTIDSGDVNGGNYSIGIRGTLPARYGTKIDKYGMSEFTIDSTSSDSGSSSGPVQLQATNAPQTVQPNETYSVTYEIKNNGQGSTAYTVTSQTNRSNVTVVDFTGDIRSKTPSADPPTASTDSVDVGQTIQFSVDYEVTANTTGTAQITTSATAPLSGNSDEATVTSTIQEQATPTDPTQRVLQITGKQQASQLTQNDVTTLITLKSRDSTQNGVTVSQNDVTTVITLFARNN